MAYYYIAMLKIACIQKTYLTAHYAGLQAIHKRVSKAMHKQ